MIEHIEEGRLYKSPSGLIFKVLHMARHAQDCSWPMVVYTNLTKTIDSEPGTIWVISESIFIKNFTTAH